MYKYAYIPCNYTLIISFDEYQFELNVIYLYQNGRKTADICYILSIFNKV